MRLSDRGGQHMTNDEYWIWLTSKHLNYKTLSVLLEVYGSALELHREREFSEVSGLKPEEKERLCAKSLEPARKVIRDTERAGGIIITWEDDEYPPLLRQIYDPPYVLYMKGVIPKWDQLFSIAVVGTRTCSDYGKRAAEHIVGGLAESGTAIVSGMARGIDTEACKISVDNGGYTIAVVANGLDQIYPRENKALFEAVSRSGMIITEYPPGMKPLRYNFPRRNRIMAGLANGVLVVQAPEKSGALITASHAVENNRDVYAVPGSMFDLGHRGTNMLIQHGAKLVMDADDILCEYPYLKPAERKPAKPEKIGTQENTPMDPSGLEGRIIALLKDGERDIDSVIRELEIDAAEMNSTLIMLEIQGRIARTGSGGIRLS